MNELSTLLKSFNMDVSSSNHKLTANAANGLGLRYEGTTGAIVMLKDGKDVAKMTTKGNQWAVETEDGQTMIHDKAEMQNVIHSLMN